MPRRTKHYTRPDAVKCLVCKGLIAVAPAGRIPEYHPDCARLHHDIRRVLSSLEAAVTGRGPEELREMRRAWAEVQAGGNIVCNRADNPAKRSKRMEQ